MSADSDQIEGPHTFFSSLNELAETVAERKSRAAGQVRQRFGLSIPTAPLSLAYFCINSIITIETGAKSLV